MVGLTERWRRDGLGRARTALAVDADAPTLLVRRGLRPGGLAGRAGDTRFTWTIAAPGADQPAHGGGAARAGSAPAAYARGRRGERSPPTTGRRR